MNKQIDQIVREEEGIEENTPLKKIYIHSLIEFRKIERILQWSRGVEENIYVVDREWAPAIKRYLDLLKLIRCCYYEGAGDSPMPASLRAPIIDEGEVVRIRRELRRSAEGDRRTFIHISYKNCRAKHIEDSGRTLIILGGFNPD